MVGLKALLQGIRIDRENVPVNDLEAGLDCLCQELERRKEPRILFDCHHERCARVDQRPCECAGPRADLHDRGLGQVARRADNLVCGRRSGQRARQQGWVGGVISASVSARACLRLASRSSLSARPRVHP